MWSIHCIIGSLTLLYEGRKCMFITHTFIYDECVGRNTQRHKSIVLTIKLCY